MTAPPDDDPTLQSMPAWGSLKELHGAALDSGRRGYVELRAEEKAAIRQAIAETVDGYAARVRRALEGEAACPAI